MCRREHLTAEDIKKNKAFIQSLAVGSVMAEDEFKVILTQFYLDLHLKVLYACKLHSQFPQQ